MTGSLHRIALLYPSVFLFRQLLLLSPDPPLPLALLYHLRKCFFLCVFILGLCIISNMEDHVVFRCDQLHAFFLQMQVFDIHISRLFRNFLEVDHDRIKQFVRFCLVMNLGKLLLDNALNDICIFKMYRNSSGNLFSFYKSLKSSAII